MVGSGGGNPLYHQLNTPYLENLRAAGVNPEDVTLVLLTHLHTDHVGWNTVWQDDRWVPLFPNAPLSVLGKRAVAGEKQRTLPGAVA
ncbi:beta-lactamase-like protein [Klebsiella pneumoniae subsp. ozaenae]|uniref:Beta-lactamase-like protein n=1 Tax=Klebsiella pneumoniae subsp. ozaenae TaxID=574 RepID=A0A377ZSJ0_KLEPO|nr:beta-lactamase-like protein [Klebsiella pneumoniae subsp. ozaenae]